MKIWEILRNIEKMKSCLEKIETIISEVKFHQEWDKEYQKPQRKIDFGVILDPIIDIAKQFKEIL